MIEVTTEEAINYITKTESLIPIGQITIENETHHFGVEISEVPEEIWKRGMAEEEGGGGVIEVEAPMDTEVVDLAEEEEVLEIMGHAVVDIITIIWMVHREDIQVLVDIIHLVGQMAIKKICLRCLLLTI